MKKENIKIIEMKESTLVYISRGIYSEKYLLNDKPLVKTFKQGWYKVEGKFESFKEVVSEWVNQRYELKNKNLYNEKIPLIIDGLIDDKYQDLLSSDLYEHKYDVVDKTILCEVEILEHIVLDEEVLFETSVGFKRYNSFRGWEEPLLIQECTYSYTHECLVESPLLELTCPVILNYETLWEILSNKLKGILNHDIVSSKFEKYNFDIKNKNKNLRVYLDIYSETRKLNNKPLTKGLYAENINQLQDKINFLANDIKNYVESCEKEITFMEYHCDFEKRYLKELKRILKIKGEL